MNCKIRFKILGILVGAILLSSCKEQTASIAPAQEIKVVNVIQQDVPIYNYFVGQIYGQEDVSINARVQGFLTGIHFIEGTRVNKGALLYTIDQEPFKADVAGEQSKVAEAQTLLVNAENELARYKPLAEINAVSQSDLDFAQANRDASMASLDAAKASLRMAEINLSYTVVKSPIAGFIGKTQARIGDFVGRSPNPVIINTVSKVENVRVQFFLTESQYLVIAREFRQKSTQERATETKIEISLILADGSLHPYHGEVDFVNREVDAETGAILVQATFPNPNLILKPGQFARVKLMLQEVEGALLVPQRSVTELQGQYSVFTVNSENKIESKQLKIEHKFGDYYIVEEGLTIDDKVVLEGLQKVRAGLEVVPVITEFQSKSNIE